MKRLIVLMMLFMGAFAFAACGDDHDDDHHDDADHHDDDNGHEHKGDLRDLSPLGDNDYSGYKVTVKQWVHADYKDGLLSVRVPKLPEAKSRPIEISTSG